MLFVINALIVKEYDTKMDNTLKLCQYICWESAVETEQTRKVLVSRLRGELVL